MFPLKWFTFLMKSESRKKKQNNGWIVDESKCFSHREVKKLRSTAKTAKARGLQKRKFSQIRNWFMIELGLNVGLRVSEMASLKHSNLLIDDNRSSIIVMGKGNKKRAVWVNSGFKGICQAYASYKKRFDFDTDGESPLLNNLKGIHISKRALQKSFKNILKTANLPGYYYIHCLRHTYTTFLLKASNYNYRFVQQQLGHASIRTTQVYASVVESDGKIALEKLYR